MLKVWLLLGVMAVAMGHAFAEGEPVPLTAGQVVAAIKQSGDDHAVIAAQVLRYWQQLAEMKSKGIDTPAAAAAIHAVTLPEETSELSQLLLKYSTELTDEYPYTGDVSVFAFMAQGLQVRGVATYQWAIEFDVKRGDLPASRSNLGSVVNVAQYMKPIGLPFFYAEAGLANNPLADAAAAKALDLKHSRLELKDLFAEGDDWHEATMALQWYCDAWFEFTKTYRSMPDEKKATPDGHRVAAKLSYLSKLDFVDDLISHASALLEAYKATPTENPKTRAEDLRILDLSLKKLQLIRISIGGVPKPGKDPVMPLFKAIEKTSSTWLKEDDDSQDRPFAAILKRCGTRRPIPSGYPRPLTEGEIREVEALLKSCISLIEKKDFTRLIDDYYVRLYTGPDGLPGDRAVTARDLGSHRDDVLRTFTHLSSDRSGWFKVDEYWCELLTTDRESFEKGPYRAIWVFKHPDTGHVGFEMDPVCSARMALHFIDQGKAAQYFWLLPTVMQERVKTEEGDNNE